MTDETSELTAADVAAIPTYDELFGAVLEALRVHTGQATNGQIAAYVIAALGLPRSVVAAKHQPGRGLSRLEYNLQWTRTYLRRYGLIDSPRRAVWLLTAAGWQHGAIDAHDIVRAVRSQMSAARLAREGQAPIFDADAQLPELPAPAQTPASEVTGPRSLTPLFPTYANVRHFLRIMEGVAVATYHDMTGALQEQSGNPQEQVDWSDPDAWIPIRLEGEVRVLAERIWHASNRQLNPRYTRGCWYLGFKHGLLSRRQGEIVRLTERGQHFLDKPDSGLDVEIDTYEGILVILHLVAEHSAARRSDLLPAYAQFCRNETTTASDTFIKTTLYDRLRNLIDRGYMLSRGHRYEATEAGLAYLGSHVATTVAPGQTPHKGPDLFRMVRELRETARRQLQEYLLGMDPIRFEELIKVLLEEMGYDNVATTAPSNDKGVDVVGTIELGISAVREVVQVKRHKGAIGRPVLDQLRGSLHRFNAVRGTVITTGKFTKGMEQAAFERGAAPITLIDGERLLDLLIEYEIGVTSRQVEYVEFAPEKLLRKIA